MALWLIDQVEKTVIRLLIENYPEWSMTPTIVAVGQRLSHQCRSADWKILVQRPSLVRQLRMIGILAKNTAQDDWEDRVRANASWYFQECYFSKLDEATVFFSALYYPRYLWSFVSEIGNKLVSWRPKHSGHALNDIELDFVALSVEQSVSHS